MFKDIFAPYVTQDMRDELKGFSMVVENRKIRLGFSSPKPIKVGNIKKETLVIQPGEMQFANGFRFYSVHYLNENRSFTEEFSIVYFKNKSEEIEQFQLPLEWKQFEKSVRKISRKFVYCPYAWAIYAKLEIPSLNEGGWSETPDSLKEEWDLKKEAKPEPEKNPEPEKVEEVTSEIQAPQTPQKSIEESLKEILNPVVDSITGSMTGISKEILDMKSELADFKSRIGKLEFLETEKKELVKPEIQITETEPEITETETGTETETETEEIEMARRPAKNVDEFGEDFDEDFDVTDFDDELGTSFDEETEEPEEVEEMDEEMVFADERNIGKKIKLLDGTIGKIVKVMDDEFYVIQFPNGKKGKLNASATEEVKGGLKEILLEESEEDFDEFEEEEKVVKRGPGRPSKKEEKVVKRGPGRPPKKDFDEFEEEEKVVKRGPGRPPKTEPKIEGSLNIKELESKINKIMAILEKKESTADTSAPKAGDIFKNENGELLEILKVDDTHFYLHDYSEDKKRKISKAKFKPNFSGKIFEV